MTAGVRLSDPDTSATAAASMAAVLRPEQERVLAAIRFVDEWNGGQGATAYEIQQRLWSCGIRREQNSIAKRCSELHDDPQFALYLIEDRSLRRPGRSGRPLIAWFPTTHEGEL